MDYLAIEAAQPRLDLSILEQMPDKGIILGVLDLGDLEVESVETVADRIRAALRHVPTRRLQIGPDCGMKYLPRDVAFGKLRAMVRAAEVVRRELLADEAQQGPDERSAAADGQPEAPETFPSGP